MGSNVWIGHPTAHVNMRLVLNLVFVLLAFATTRARRGDPRNKYYMDVFLKMSNETCGKQKPIKDWEVTNDLLVIYRFFGTQNLQDRYFKDGVFHVPLTGMYHCCASARCKKGGSCKLSITKNGDKD